MFVTCSTVAYLAHSSFVAQRYVVFSLCSLRPPVVLKILNTAGRQGKKDAVKNCPGRYFEERWGADYQPFAVSEMFVSCDDSTGGAAVRFMVSTIEEPSLRTSALVCVACREQSLAH